MKDGLLLLPDALLLIALLRMTSVHLYSSRPAVFAFLVVWFVYSVFTLFPAQLFASNSLAYLRIFEAASATAWMAALPAAFEAGQKICRSSAHSIFAIGVLAVAVMGCYLAAVRADFAEAAKTLAVNCWIAAAVGSLFLIASIGADDPDRILWRGAGAFFAIYGYGYLCVGIFRPGGWAYPALILLGSLAWLLLALWIGPTADHLFNLEKLAVLPAAFRVFPVLSRRARG